MHNIDIVKLFIRAERTGDWNLHLISVGKMLNLFAATGHNNYAKCARLYLQQMMDLPSSHPWLYEKFAYHGYHTVRRSERFWAGLWTDLVIEQVMMRSIKSRGGLTRGRGMTEAVRLMWVYKVHRCAEVHDAMTSLTNLKHTTSEQHTECGKARARRDTHDTIRLVNWFDSYDPFDLTEPSLRSISSGLTAQDGDKINCDRAEEVGLEIHRHIDDAEVSDVSFKRSNQIQGLSHLQKGIKRGQETVHIENANIFSRLIVLADRSDSMESIFHYELTTVPSSLFKDLYMRKANKSKLALALTNNITNPANVPTDVQYVLDGGALLHRVWWPTQVSYKDVSKIYNDYILKHYGVCTVVFDGYENGPSTKDHEHQRRITKSTANITINENMVVHRDQDQFLANSNNKLQLISLLSKDLSAAGHNIKQATDDADTLIASCALDIASEESVVVVADDIDILILLLYHFKSGMQDVLLKTGSKKCHKRVTKIVDIRETVSTIDVTIIPSLLFVHAWSGCDTTSAIFGHSKVSVLRKLQNTSEMKNISYIFNRYNATQEDISIAGQRFFVRMYDGKFEKGLTELRYNNYMKMSISSKSNLQPQRLPPSERAAHFHSLRVHLQVIKWKSLGSDGKDPTQWGWCLKDDSLIPEMTDQDVGPDALLNFIRCKCKSTSRRQCASTLCSCVKHGLKCVSACWDCHGDSCNNTNNVIIDDDDDDHHHHHHHNTDMSHIY